MRFDHSIQPNDMKNIKSIISFLALALVVLLSACGTTYDTASDRNPDERDEYRGKRVTEIQNPQSLADFLLRAPGVAIVNGEVSIRGGGPPLFIIDGVPVGNGYYSASSAINPLDIQSVEIVSGPDTAIYGRRGINGVVVIRTKTAS